MSVRCIDRNRANRESWLFTRIVPISRLQAGNPRSAARCTYNDEIRDAQSSRSVALSSELLRSRTGKIYSAALHLHACHALSPFSSAIPSSQQPDFLPRRAIVNRAGSNQIGVRCEPGVPYMNEEQIASNQHARCTGSEAPRHRRTKSHGFSAGNTLEMNRVSAGIRKNEKSKDAERSEPNPGKLPGRDDSGFPSESRRFPTRGNAVFFADATFPPHPGAQSSSVGVECS